MHYLFGFLKCSQWAKSYFCAWTSSAAVIKISTNMMSPAIYLWELKAPRRHLSLSLGRRKRRADKCISHEFAARSQPLSAWRVLYVLVSAFLRKECARSVQQCHYSAYSRRFCCVPPRTGFVPLLEAERGKAAGVRVSHTKRVSAIPHRHQMGLRQNVTLFCRGN